MTYNIDHSTEFGEVIRDLMRSDAYKHWAPEEAWLEREDCSAKGFRTVARAATLDGDYSFRALGFQTGFTGKGADCLIGDDPYANPEDAMSEAVNGRTIRTYQNQIKLRVGANSPLIFMYHRYHEGDLGGALLEEGGWTNLRFPCIADSRDNEDGSDPTGREDGELLSDLWPKDHILNIRDTDPYVFASMYQGRPKPADGGYFQRSDFQIGQVPHLDLVVRYWDLATSIKETGDWTAGAKGGMGPNQFFYLMDMVRFKMEWPDVCQIIAEITEKEAYEYQQKGIQYVVGVDARMSQQGFFQQLLRQRIFNPEDNTKLTVPIWPDKAPIDKKQSANGIAADGRRGRLILQLGPWNDAYINECLAFTGQPIDTDDQVDASSGLHRLVWHLKGGINHDRTRPQPGSNAWLERLLKKQAKTDSLVRR